MGQSNHSVMNKSSNEWEQDNPLQSSSPSLFVQEAVGLASNQHFNLASWHYQFTDRQVSFVLSWIQFYLKVSRPSLFLSVAFYSPGEWNSPDLFNCCFIHVFFLWLCWIRCVFCQWTLCCRSTSREFISSYLSALRACSQLTTLSLHLSPPTVPSLAAHKGEQKSAHELALNCIHLSLLKTSFAVSMTTRL